MSLCEKACVRGGSFQESSASWSSSDHLSSRSGGSCTLCVLGESGRTWTERGLDLCLYVSIPSPHCLSKSQLSFVRGHALVWHVPFSAWLSDGWERTPWRIGVWKLFWHMERDWGRWGETNRRVDRNLGKIVQITEMWVRFFDAVWLIRLKTF